MNLKQSEVICDKCKGTGYDLKIPQVENNETYYQNHYPCDKCQGDGKLDWIEAVVGKKKSIRFGVLNYSMMPCLLSGSVLIGAGNVA